MGGDSLGAYVVTGLLGGIADPALSTIRHDFRNSSGLARPDFVDWPNTIAAVATTEPSPEVFVFMIGGNDNQPMIDPASRQALATLSPEWQAEYRIRVRSIMDLAHLNGAELVWIGLPPPRSGVRLELNPTINSILAEEAATRDWVEYLDIGPLLSDENGAYAERLAGPDGGEPIRVRAADGVHITSRASAWIADLVWQRLAEQWSLLAIPERESGAGPIPGPAAIDGPSATG